MKVCPECGHTDPWRISGSHKGSMACAVTRMANEMAKKGWAPVDWTFRKQFKALGIPYEMGPDEWYASRATTRRPIFAPDWAVAICVRWQYGSIQTHYGPVYAPYPQYKVFFEELKRVAKKNKS